LFNRREYLQEVKHIVIKVGVTSITHSTGLLNLERTENLDRQIADLHNRAIEVTLVSSEAIGAGTGKLNLKERSKTATEKHSAAAVGQGILIHASQEIMSEYGKNVPQILVTKDDPANRCRFLNARHRIFSLLAHHVTPSSMNMMPWPRMS
jgi:glutamate 5-kinase